MKSKKVLAILLSLAIMLTFMPTMAFAAEDQGWTPYAVDDEVMLGIESDASETLEVGIKYSGSARPGFVYEWYAGEYGTDKIGTDNTLDVTDAGTYLCYVVEDGKEQDLENCVEFTVTKSDWYAKGINASGQAVETDAEHPVVKCLESGSTELEVEVTAQKGEPDPSYAWKTEGGTLVGTGSSYTALSTGKYTCEVAEENTGENKTVYFKVNGAHSYSTEDATYQWYDEEGEELTPVYSRYHRWYEVETEPAKYTAELTCTNCSHKKTEDAEITSDHVSDPTCTSRGTDKYTATFTTEGLTPYTLYYRTPTPGHSYGEPTYTWYKGRHQEGSWQNRHWVYDDPIDPDTVNAADITSTIYCVAERECSVCEDIDSDVAVVSAKDEEQSVDPTCTEDGKDVYVAEFDSEVFEDQTLEATVDALGHDFEAPTYTWYDENGDAIEEEDDTTVPAYCVGTANCSRCEYVEVVEKDAEVDDVVDATYNDYEYTTYVAVFVDDEEAVDEAAPAFENQYHTVKTADPLKDQADDALEAAQAAYAEAEDALEAALEEGLTVEEAAARAAAAQIAADKAFDAAWDAQALADAAAEVAPSTAAKEAGERQKAADGLFEDADSLLTTANEVAEEANKALDDKQLSEARAAAMEALNKVGTGYPAEEAAKVDAAKKALEAAVVATDATAESVNAATKALNDAVTEAEAAKELAAAKAAADDAKKAADAVTTAAYKKASVDAVSAAKAELAKVYDGSDAEAIRTATKNLNDAVDAANKSGKKVASQISITTKKLTIKKGKKKSIKVTGVNGQALTFSKVKGNKNISVTSSGKIKLKKKGLKKGKTYKVTVQVTAAANDNVLAGTATKKIKVKVK